VLTEHETPDSPDWWLLRLGRRLRARQGKLRVWRDYYRGDHPLPQGPKKATDAYRDFQKKARTNFMEMVVDASVDRLRVLGITDSQGRPDDDANRWWQLNRLDARQILVYRTALSLSESYVIVGPHPADRRRPLITVEHPSEVIVEHDPATRERRAALKAWYDDVAGVARANVWLPGRVIKYVTERRGPGPLPWGPGAWTISEDIEHNLGVPVVPFSCRPGLDEDPQPEFGGVIDIQDRINLGVLNRMTAERYSAFRQKWVKGHKFKRRVDPETGLETIEQPFVPDPAGLWASEGENTQFGEFSQTQLLDYLKAHELDIRDLLVVSRTPAYYYAGDLVNIGADTVLALDLLHVAKVEEHALNFGESWEDVNAEAALVAGVDRDFSAAEVRWRDPRQFNPSVVADMATKYKSIGYPLAVIAEKSGESPQMVQRIVSESAADQLAAAAALQLATQAQPDAQAAATAPGGVDAGA